VNHIAAVGRVLVARGVGAIAAFISVTFAARLIIEHAGPSAYGAVSLVATLVALVPFADLGIGAAVVNASSDVQHGVARTGARAELAAAVRLLLIVGAVVGCVSLLIGLFGAWPQILGPGAEGVAWIGIGTTLVGVLFGLGLPAYMATRLLQGWQAVALIALIGIAAPVLSLTITALLVTLGSPPGLLAIPPAIGALMASLLLWIPAVRRYPGSLMRDLVRTPTQWSDYGAVLRLGATSLAVSIGLALMLQSQRITLSHFSTPEELAQYALLAPLLFGIQSLITPAGQYLWPRYRQLMHKGEMTRATLARDIALFAVIGLIGAVAFVLAGPPVIHFMAGGTVSASWELYAIGAALILLQSLQTPPAMTLMDRSGLRIQAFIIMPVALASISLGVLFAPSLGAAGVLISVTAMVLVVQIPLTLASAIRAIRRSALTVRA